MAKPTRSLIIDLDQYADSADISAERNGERAKGGFVIGSLSHMGSRSINGLREENARLKDLVVTLSALVLKNVVHESNKHPRSNAEEEEIAEALDAAGHELMAKAVEMRSVIARHK